MSVIIFRWYSILGLVGHVAVFGCRLWSKSFTDTVFELAGVDCPKSAVARKQTCVYLIKRVGSLVTIHVRKNKSTMQNLSSENGLSTWGAREAGILTAMKVCWVSHNTLTLDQTLL